MQLELEKMKELGKKGKSSDPYKTPPPRVSAPTPQRPVEVHPPADRPPPQTEGAKMNRLRRLCEKKPSGKCRVPDAVHERWRKATKEEKEAMIEELEAANWSQDRYNRIAIATSTTMSLHDLYSNIITHKVLDPLLFAGTLCVPHHQEDVPEENAATKAKAGVVHEGENAEDIELVNVT